MAGPLSQALSNALARALGDDAAARDVFERLTAIDALTAVDLAMIEDITPGTVLANKAVVAGPTLDVAALRNLTITGNLVTGTTTLSESELAVLDGVAVQGTAYANKALVLGAAKEIGTITTLTAENISVNALTMNGWSTLTAQLGTVAGTGVTAIEEGMLPLHRTTLTFVNTPISMTDEAGVVAWGAQKVYTFQAGNLLLLGAVANLTVTLSSVQTATATITAAAGCTGAGDLIITVTGADLNGGTPLNVTVPLTTGADDASKVATLCRAAVGAVTAISTLYTVGGSAATITLKRTRTGGTDTTLNIDINADDAGTTATGITNATSSVNTTTGIVAAWDGDFGLGTTIADNTAALESTEQDIIASTATPQAVAGATTAKGFSTVIQAAALNGLSSAKEVYLNFLIDDADHNIGADASKLVVNGTITLTWINLGHY